MTLPEGCDFIEAWESPGTNADLCIGSDPGNNYSFWDDTDRQGQNGFGNYAGTPAIFWKMDTKAWQFRVGQYTTGGVVNYWSEEMADLSGIYGSHVLNSTSPHEGAECTLVIS